MRSLNSDREIHEGLRKSTLYQEIDDQTGFSLIYEWETQEDCERYLGTEKFGVLLGAFKVLCEKSEIRCGGTLWDGRSIPIPANDPRQSETFFK